MVKKIEMKNKNTDEFIRKTKKTIKAILPVLQNAAMGDFSKKIKVPKKEDEFTELLVSINLMIEDLRSLRNEMDLKIKEKTKNLKEKILQMEKMNKLMVGRELKMIELKEEIKELENKLKKK